MMKPWVAALVLGAVGSAALSADVPPTPFATGAEAISPEEYDRLPKLGKFRAWLPKRVDLSASFPVPGNQQQQPNCTAWATTYAARSFFHGRELGRQPLLPAEQMSPAYVYNRLRPAGSACRGSFRVIDALNVLQNEGVVSLADWPYEDRNCAMSPPPELRQKAAAYRLGGWRAIDREVPSDHKSPVVLDDIKGALARSEPVVFIMPITDDFFALKGEGVFSHPQPASGNMHAMAIVGYDEDRQAFRVINSWGAGWGDKGYAWVGYDTFRMLVSEAYALEAPTGLAAPIAPVAVTPQSFDAMAAKLACGNVQVSRAGGRLTVTGFGGSQDKLVELKYAALALDPKAVWNVQLNAWPQCEARLTLGNALAAGEGQMALIVQSDSGVAVGGDPIVLHAGEKFGILAETWPTRPFLSVFYLQADGSAVELYRGKPEPNRERRRAINIGADGAKAVRFQVSAPFGDEVVIAVASAGPLWDGSTTYATERQFLTSLRAKLAGAPAGTVAARVIRIRTNG